MFVYLLRNSLDGKCYVGLTKHPDVNVRLGQHRRGANPRNANTAIGRAIKKHGWEAFEKFVLERCEAEDELIEAEKRWIRHYNCMAPTGYNMTEGGESYVLGEEERLRRSERMKGHTVSEETKRKIGDANRGHIHTPEHRAKLGAARRGGKMSDHNKARLKEALNGLPSATCVLDWNKVRDIRAKYATGDVTQYELADMFGVSVATISRIVKRKIWHE